MPDRPLIGAGDKLDQIPWPPAKTRETLARMVQHSRLCPNPAHGKSNMIGLIRRAIELRKRSTYGRCMIMKCRKSSTYHRRSGAGLCTEHALLELDNLHPEDRAELATRHIGRG